MKFIAPLLVAITFTSCSRDNITPQGEIVSVSRSFYGYNAIEIEDDIEVIVQNSGERKIVVQCHQNIEPYIITQQEKGVLRVSIKEQIRPSQTIEAKVYIEGEGIEKYSLKDNSSATCTMVLHKNVEIKLDNSATFAAEINNSTTSITTYNSSRAIISGKSKETIINCFDNSIVDKNSLQSASIISKQPQRFINKKLANSKRL